MNAPLLLKLAETLRALPDERLYNQCDWKRETPCGTAHCLAGFVCSLVGRSPKNLDTQEISAVAGEALGLSLREHIRLFVATPDIRLSTFGLEREKRAWQVEGVNLDDTAWPAPFGDAYRLAMGRGLKRKRPSEVAADLCEALAAGEVSL